jgi:hypothetical protein
MRLPQYNNEADGTVQSAWLLISADDDVRHSFNANYVWEIPVKAALGGHGPDALVEGWQVSGTIFVRTGSPYTVFDFRESGQLAASNYFGALYAVSMGPLVQGPHG